MFAISKPKENKPGLVEAHNNNKPEEFYKKPDELVFNLIIILNSVENSFLSLKKSYDENKGYFKKS